ncbi:MAG: arabinose efflux permease family protein [Nonomuraea muscovyensis]|nr:arabinose efflux permease family protein [Nonomuraea muscovyensis]
MTTVRPPRAVSRKTVRLLAAAYGLTIANLYYCQPLLTEISRSLGPHAAARTAGLLLAAGVLIGLTAAVVLTRVMPPAPPDLALPYRAQLRATVRLAATHRLLRRRSFIGACSFAAFGVFWSTVALRLTEPPYEYGPAQIGLLALVGAAASFAALWAGGHHVAWLLIGLLAMATAINATHLLNMSVVYGIDDARARLASVYMTVYTLGGVTGAAAGPSAYAVGGWSAACLLGAAFLAIALVLTFTRTENP